MTAEQKAREIIEKWYEVLGGGFHPDDAGAEYVDFQSGKPALTAGQAEDFDEDMAVLAGLDVDQYALCLQVIAEKAIEDSFCEGCGTPLTEDNSAIGRPGKCVRCGIV